MDAPRRSLSAGRAASTVRRTEEGRTRDRAAPEFPVTFLVGAERSGTTLLRLMLDGHPRLAFRYEFELAVDLVPDGEGWPELETYYEHLRTMRWVDPPPHVDRALDYPSLVRSFLEQKRSADRKPLVGATVHRHYDRLLRIWPDARFVHLVRDGRDVARSTVAIGWAGNVWTACEHWAAAERLWAQVAATLPADRRIDVHYEELVRDPRATLERICAFIGIEYDEAMLEYPQRSSYRAPDPALAERWRETFAPHELRLVESRIGELLVERGYPLSGAPLAPPSLPLRAALAVHCRAGRAQHAARSLGVRLWLERLLAHRVGPRWWREAVQLRIHEVVNAQLA
ncbi:MAG: sulfotransferase [Myxococcota bacterium]|nr:sulfotransferase [Myxococcota bacterium]